MHASWDPNANSRLRGTLTAHLSSNLQSNTSNAQVGTVRLTPSGDVRWTTLSVFHGESRWRSESIQVGGLRSARGVVGTWFDKDYDANGPAGPTAFWKVTDELSHDPGVDADLPESLGVFN